MNDYQYINENGSPRDYYEIVNENGELCKEIERLSKEVDMWNKKYNEQFDIINEFEKWLKAHLDEEFYWFKMYDKLQELKGDSSNDSRRDV